LDLQRIRRLQWYEKRYQARVARLSLTQHTKTGKIYQMTNDRYRYQMTKNYTKWPKILQITKNYTIWPKIQQITKNCTKWP
jgi:hypothetical protein